MVQCLKNLSFTDGLLPLAFGQARHVDLLDDAELLGTLGLHKKGLAKRTFAEKLDLAVDFKLGFLHL